MPKAAWTARRRVCSNDTHLPAAADGPAPSGRRPPHQELSALVRRRLLCSGPTPAGRLWDGSRAAFPRTPKVRRHGAPRRVSRPVGGAAGDGPPSSGSGGRHTGLPAGLPGFRQGRARRDAAPIRCALQPPGAGSGRPARPAAGGRSGRWPDGPSGAVPDLNIQLCFSSAAVRPISRSWLTTSDYPLSSIRARIRSTRTEQQATSGSTAAVSEIQPGGKADRLRPAWRHVR